MSRTTKIMGFSVPPAVVKEVETLAKRERRTKSELFREMVRVYRRYRDQRDRLSRYGARQAKKLGIKPQDIDRIVHDYRARKQA